MKEWIQKWDLSFAGRIFLVLLDVIFINCSSFMALWLRFNMNFTEIPPEYAESIRELVLVNTVITVVIFALFRLYNSLWRFASIKELVYIMGACMLSVLFNMMAFYLTEVTLFFIRRRCFF